MVFVIVYLIGCFLSLFFYKYSLFRRYVSTDENDKYLYLIAFLFSYAGLLASMLVHYVFYVDYTE